MHTFPHFDTIYRFFFTKKDMIGISVTTIASRGSILSQSYFLKLFS